MVSNVGYNNLSYDHVPMEKPMGMNYGTKCGTRLRKNEEMNGGIPTTRCICRFLNFLFVTLQNVLFTNLTFYHPKTIVLGISNHRKNTSVKYHSNVYEIKIIFFFRSGKERWSIELRVRKVNGNSKAEED